MLGCYTGFFVTLDPSLYTGSPTLDTRTDAPGILSHWMGQHVTLSAACVFLPHHHMWVWRHDGTTSARLRRRHRPGFVGQQAVLYEPQNLILASASVSSMRCHDGFQLECDDGGSVRLSPTVVKGHTLKRFGACGHGVSPFHHVQHSNSIRTSLVEWVGAHWSFRN